MYNMEFELFTPLFNKIDNITTAFVTDFTSRSIAAITPIVSVGLTLSFIAYGMLVIRGVIDMPVMELLKKLIHISIITSIALGAGLYQGVIAEMIRTIPDELATSLILNPSHETAKGAAYIIDEAADVGFSKAGLAFEKAGFFAHRGIVYAIYGLLILLTTSILVAIGGAILLLTKLVLAILAGLGPFFIIALLWKPTVRFFDMWIAQVVNYILLVVLFSATFGLMISIFSGYMMDMELDGVQSVSYSLGGAVILSIAMVVILVQLPKVSAGLAGGVSIGYLYEFHAIRGAAASFYSSRSGTGYKNASNYAGSNIHSSERDSRDNSKGKVAYGYFKGKPNKTNEHLV